LISRSSGSTSSAPSMVTSMDGRSASVASGIPSARARRSVSIDVGTPAIPPHSPAARRSAITSRRWRTVEPVPSPTVIPSWIHSAARSAAFRFSASALPPAASMRPPWSLV